MKAFASRVAYSVLFYALLTSLVIVAKPDFMFDKSSGRPLPFGVGEGKTLYSLGVATVALAIASFYVFALIDMIYS